MRIFIQILMISAAGALALPAAPARGAGPEGGCPPRLARVVAGLKSGFRTRVAPAFTRQALKDSLARRAAAIRAYRAEYRNERGGFKWSRLFIKKRDTANPPRGLHRLAAYLSNPIATRFNRPREVTMGVSMAGYLLLVEGPLLVLEARAESQELKEAQRAVDEGIVPGVAYVWGLMESGALEPGDGAKRILGHAKDLLKWAKARRGEGLLLGRVEDMVAGGLITAGEAAKLDGIMHRVYLDTLQRLMKDEQGSEKLTDALSEGLRKALADPASGFASRSAVDRELLSSAYWPSVRIGERSDLELGRAIFTEGPGRPPVLGEVAGLVGAEAISMGEAYRMAAEALDDGKALDERSRALAAALGGGRVPSRRPDIPRFAKPLKLGEWTASGEVDRWRKLATDPRFADLEAAWNEGKAGEAELLLAFETRARSLEELAAIQSPESLADEKVANLFGLPEGEGNVLLLESKAQITEIAERASLSPEGVRACLRKMAGFWSGVYREEAAWAAGGISEDEFLRRRQSRMEPRVQAYGAALGSCAESGSTGGGP